MEDTYYVPPDGHWARDGEIIGRNTQLQSLAFYYENEFGTSRTDLESFFEGVAANRSIKKLTLSEFPDGDVFSALVPFFKNNKDFSSLNVWGYYDFEIDSNFNDKLATAVGGFESLKECTLLSTLPGEKTRLIQALFGHSNLKRLILYGVHIGRNECTALLDLINKPNMTLTTLHLSIDGIDIGVVGDLVEGLKNIKYLSLSANRNTSDASWRAFFDVLHQSPSYRLKQLNLSSCTLNDANAVSLSSALSSNTGLKELDLSWNPEITTAGWRGIFTFLPKCRLYASVRIISVMKQFLL